MLTLIHFRASSWVECLERVYQLLLTLTHVQTADDILNTKSNVARNSNSVHFDLPTTHPKERASTLDQDVAAWSPTRTKKVFPLLLLMYLDILML